MKLGGSLVLCNKRWFVIMWNRWLLHRYYGCCCIAIICRDGRQLSDDEIVGMLIGLLLAGQHTSSTTSAWLGFFIAGNKELQVTYTTVLVDVSTTW